MTIAMECRDVRAELLDLERGRLGPEPAAAVRAHLATCAACAAEAAADRALTDVLERRLPQYPGTIALKRRLAAAWTPPAAAGVPSRSRRWWLPGAALAAAVLALVVLPPAYRRLVAPPGSPVMLAEAVNDHLRVLNSQHPVEVESGAIHQVRPWFEGRLDFAPVVRFAGDAEFPLAGGTVGYFLDRKAAVFVYKRRLHTVTLLVFRADGLPWPRRGVEAPGPGRAQPSAVRGFNVLLWREGELGYALVADIEPGELAALASKLAG